MNRNKRLFEQQIARKSEEKNAEAWPHQIEIASYSIKSKKGHLQRLFRELESQGRLGKNLLDVGSGGIPITSARENR